MDPNIEGLDDVFLATLSTELGVEWDRFGLFLGFRQAQIDQLREAYPRNVSRCIRQLLTKWRDTARAHGETCLLQNLASALQMAGRVDLADNLMSKVTTGSEGADVVDGKVAEQCPWQQKDYMEEIVFEDVDAFRTEYDNIKSQTRLLLNQMRKNEGLFVMTEGWRSVMTEFDTKNHVTICGNAGSGKTSLALHILLTLLDKGHDVIAVSNPNLIEKVFNPDKEMTIFFCDDAFGAPEVSGLLTETWLRLHDKIRSFLKTGRFGLILTTRKQVLNSCRMTFERCESYVCNIQDLDSFKLTAEEKKEMFANHCRNKNVHLTDISEFVKEKAHDSDLSCFPLLCKLYSADQKLHEVADFFQRPLPVLVQQLQVLTKAQPRAYCGLLLILVHDGKLPSAIFDVFDKTAGRLSREQIEDIKEACGLERSEPIVKILDGLKSITDVYVEEDDDANFTFIHDSIFDAVSFVFGLQFPNRIIEICSPNFLHRRVRSSGMNERYGTCCPAQRCVQDNCRRDFADVIFVPKRSDVLLARRFLRDMMSGYIYEVFDNPSIRDGRMVQLIVNEVTELPQEQMQTLLSVRDRTTNRQMSYCIADSGLIFLAKCIVDAGLYLDLECLLCCCSKGHADMVDFFAESGMDLNRVSSTCGRSAIHIAAAMADDTLLQHLIQHGADIHTRAVDGVYAITMAARKCSVPCLKFLLQKSADVNVVDSFDRKPIHYAAGGGVDGLQCVKLLVDAGADPLSASKDGYMTIHFAAECECSATLRYLLEKGADPNSQNVYKKRPLHYAGKFGHAENISLLLEAGAEVGAEDTKGRQALHEYCAYAFFSKETMRLLIRNNLNAKDYRGMTPLHIACWLMRDKGFTKAKEMVDSGADISIVDLQGMQPLVYALVNHSPKITSLFLVEGADPNCKGHNGMTPLHFACLNGNLYGARQLLEANVKVDALDDSRYTSLAYARFKGYADLVQLLTEHGADPERTVDVEEGLPVALRALRGKWCSSSLSLSSSSASLSSQLSSSSLA